MSLQEQIYADQRAKARAKIEAQEALIKTKNAALGKELHEYKGFEYRMNQYGNYVITKTKPESGLEGVFTSVHTLRYAIDMFERQSKTKQ